MTFPVLYNELGPSLSVSSCFFCPGPPRCLFRKDRIKETEHSLKRLFPATDSNKNPRNDDSYKRVKERTR